MERRASPTRAASLTAAALRNTWASTVNLPTPAIRDPDLGAKMAALAPSKCRLMPCPASPVRVRWVTRLRCARFPCPTPATLGRANTAERVYSARWITTPAPARRDSAAPNAKLSTTAPYILAKTVPSAPLCRTLTAALALLDSLARRALWTLTSVNATRASTVAVSTPTDHTNVTATRVTLARIAKISMCHAVRLHARMVVRAKPSILSTTNAVVRLALLVPIAKKMSTTALVIYARMEPLASMASIPTHVSVPHPSPGLIVIKTSMNVL